MGWGCYKHEFDAGSEEWEARMGPLCDRKLAERPLTFGRDNQICPACYEELEAERDELRARADSYHEGMVNRTKIIGQLEAKLEVMEQALERISELSTGQGVAAIAIALQALGKPPLDVGSLAAV